MFTMAAGRMGYRVDVFAPPYEDLSRLREFAARVDVVTVTSGDVPMIALQAAAGSSALYPPVKTFEEIENGVGAKRDAAMIPLADFCVIAARTLNGESAFYDPIAIDRLDGALDIARSPAKIGLKLERKAVAMTRDILEDLDVVGIACVEFTLTEEHELVVHDVTPHPHRSGHLTVDACVTSQFEQQVRAACGLPLGSTRLLRPAAMAVLAKSIWENGEPNWASACAFPQVKLHLYGVHNGHLTATAASGTRAKQIVRAARTVLNP